MAYRSNDSGCLAQLLGWGLLIIIGLTISGISTLSDRNSYIKEARQAVENQDSERAANRYLRFLREVHSGKKAKEAIAYLTDYYEHLPLYHTTSSGDIVSDIKTFTQVEEDFKYECKDFYEKIKEIKDSKVESEYQVAIDMETIDGWELFKKKVDDSYWDEADRQIQNVIEKNWNTEPKAWAAARNSGTLFAYTKYLELYPHGAHASIADKKVIDHTVDMIYAGDHGSLPSMDRRYYGQGSTSSITVKNDTQYTLTLLYSGPSSKRLILDPNERRTITLTNGNYRIAASVNTSSVRSYTGEESLYGGGYDVSYYISTTTSHSSFDYSKLIH